MKSAEGLATADGYDEVDGQGQVRHLMMTATSKGDGTQRAVTTKPDVTFGDFGTSVTVTLPAASQLSQVSQVSQVSQAKTFASSFN